MEERDGDLHMNKKGMCFYFAKYNALFSYRMSELFSCLFGQRIEKWKDYYLINTAYSIAELCVLHVLDS